MEYCAKKIVLIDDEIKSFSIDFLGISMKEAPKILPVFQIYLYAYRKILCVVRADFSSIECQKFY